MPLNANERTSFDDWVAALRTEAKKIGISEKTLNESLSGIQFIPRVIELDRRQPEFTLSFWRYISRAVSNKRIEKGKKLLSEHKNLLNTVYAKYNVQPRFLVAFWGLETNFGKTTGSFPLIASLATLAYDKRRSKFFRKQLIAALQIIDRGDIQGDIKSSWAGAMGNMQFMPTTYKAYAIDGDQDGVRDHWNSLPDIFSSAANYLSRSGWTGEFSWGSEVNLPRNFDLALSGLNIQRRLSEWFKLGIRLAQSRDLPRDDIKASLVVPAGYQGPAFLVYQNFRSTLKWNRSIFYAIAVGHLADRIHGYGAFKAPRPNAEQPLSVSNIKEIQRHLMIKGFNVGKADGVVGVKTREAIRVFQKKTGVPADGFPSINLLTRLRQTDN